jgi:hypothetical protein
MYSVEESALFWAVAARQWAKIIFTANIALKYRLHPIYRFKNANILD